MDRSQLPRPSAVEYRFNRPVCHRWATFLFAFAGAGVVLAFVSSDERFVRGLLPGWLFGGAGAALLAFFGVSWVRRSFHRGTALRVDADGIEADHRLGGPTTPRIRGIIPWDNVIGVEHGRHDSVIVRLKDPDAFWAGRGIASRFLNGDLRTGDRLSLGGNDLDAPSTEVVRVISRWVEWAKLAGASTESLPDGELTAGDGDAAPGMS